MPKPPVCIAFLVLLTSASVAHAEGARLEIHGGYDQLDNEHFFSASDSTFRPVKGAAYGLGIGYDFRIGEKAFAGIEGNADFSRIPGTLYFKNSGDTILNSTLTAPHPKTAAHRENTDTPDTGPVL